jgi:hypothetical protein
MKKEKKTEQQEKCFCPYCEEELIIANFPYCKPCGIVFSRCLKCNITVLDKDAVVCPNCGEPLKRGEKKG